jgi:hypothetical protein
VLPLLFANDECTVEVFAVAAIFAVMATLADLGTRFQALRARPGHFGGGGWDDDVDKFNGLPVVSTAGPCPASARHPNAHARTQAPSIK